MLFSVSNLNSPHSGINKGTSYLIYIFCGPLQETTQHCWPFRWPTFQIANGAPNFPNQDSVLLAGSGPVLVYLGRSWLMWHCLWPRTGSQVRIAPVPSFHTVWRGEWTCLVVLGLCHSNSATRDPTDKPRTILTFWKFAVMLVGSTIRALPGSLASLLRNFG